MFWKTLNLVVNCTFLLLAITIMTILIRNEGYRNDLADYEIALQELRQEINKVNQSNFVYLETKLNRVAGNQDSYQTNITSRLDVLENRMKSLETQGKGRPTRLTNINNNTLSAAPYERKEAK